LIEILIIIVNIILFYFFLLLLLLYNLRFFFNLLTLWRSRQANDVLPKKLWALLVQHFTSLPITQQATVSTIESKIL